MNALHEQFIVEARELIQQATDDLIAVEREGAEPDRIDRVFRAFHTLKGSAGVVDMPPMNLTLHAAEDLIAAIHAGKLGASPAVIDQALSCLDQVSQWVDTFEARGSLPPRAGDDARAMAERLRELLSENAPEQRTKPGRASSTIGPGPALPEWVSGLVESQRARISDLLQEAPAALHAVSYEPHVGCFFNGDDPVHLMRQIPNLLAFRIEAREAWPPLADLDPFACNLRLQGISAGTHAELSNIFRLVPDQVRIIELPLAAVRLERGLRAGDGDTAGLIRAVIEEQREVLRFSDQSEEDLVGRIGAAARAAASALRHGLLADLAEHVELASAAALARRDATLLLAAIDSALASLAGGLPAAEAAGALVSGSAGLPADEAERSASRSLRVDESKIDALVNLAGELIVAKNAFAHLAKRVEDEVPGRELARAVRREQAAIERLASDMHASILQLRMVPLSQVFRSFPRLVRDMSQRLERKVELVMRGETMEADKTIVDRLFEPLLHLVRNALDHGVESFEQRRAAGKPESATVTMQASRAGDRLVVQVIDDGRGIDPEIVRRKARERRLLGTDELAALSDEQALDLIFSAGFSTAAEVSDISGRGVGMDVVRATVEQIGGRVSLTSRVGAGTTVRLDLPMNIAMSRIMVVAAGAQVFGIPMDAVTETVRLTPDRISRIKNNDGFVLRDRVVPICSLAELMSLPASPASGSDARLLVVTEVSGKIAALEVDAIRDRLEVVLKPMQGLLSNARGYSGTTLLGDGGVLLVLDLKELLP
jgi:two-component system, chemotaxis family, sensor kinase CheA